ncbi:MAG: 4-alpha-glucanotransferase, partial [Anaerolineae bacterium]|nr:4-alpha-glucanotransferase [Anaerolineae bacterium]
MKFPRASGILMHPTSLPGRFGLGDLGDEAYRFVDFLVSAGQTYWQVLPLSPTGYGDSPYQGLSAFAGNPMLISPDRLVAEGYLWPADLEDVPDFPVECVDFGPVIRYKEELLDRAFANFALQATEKQQAALTRFEQEQAFWLDDVALFMAIKEAQGLRPWVDWPEGLARRRPGSLDEVRRTLAYEIRSQKFRQWQF